MEIKKYNENAIFDKSLQSLNEDLVNWILDNDITLYTVREDDNLYMTKKEVLDMLKRKEISVSQMMDRSIEVFESVKKERKKRNGN